MQPRVVVHESAEQDKWLALRAQTSHKKSFKYKEKMWGWLTGGTPAAVSIPAINSEPLTCAALLQFATSTLNDDADWATFITMTREYNLDTMCYSDVVQRFKLYQQHLNQQPLEQDADIVSVPVSTPLPPPDPCSPRALAEFMYLMTPDRWTRFQQFAATTDINALSFHALLTQFFEFEQRHEVQ